MKNYENTIKRRDMISSGAYDGRFTTKLVADKKKKERKEWARQKISFNFSKNQ